MQTSLFLKCIFSAFFHSFSIQGLFHVPYLGELQFFFFWGGGCKKTKKKRIKTCLHSFFLRFYESEKHFLGGSRVNPLPPTLSLDTALFTCDKRQMLDTNSEAQIARCSFRSNCMGNKYLIKEAHGATLQLAI